MHSGEHFLLAFLVIVPMLANVFVIVRVPMLMGVNVMLAFFFSHNNLPILAEVSL
jgi:hypothetical protein